MNVVVAAPTFFDERGALDREAWERHLAELEASVSMAAGSEAPAVDAILVAGTTGEGASLSLDERLDLFESAAATLRRAKIWMGLHTSSMGEALELEAEVRGKVEAILLTPPTWEADLRDEGAVRYFDAILSQVETPIVLYHIPRRSRIPITESILARLARHPRLGGIKDSGGNLDATKRFVAAGARVYLGSDSNLAEAGALGVAGVVSALGAIAPDLVARAARDGDLDAARQVADLRNALRMVPLPLGIKNLLARRGLPPYCRPPLPLE